MKHVVLKINRNILKKAEILFRKQGQRKNKFIAYLLYEWDFGFFNSNVYLDSILYSPLYHTFHNRLCILTYAFVCVFRHAFG
jgi:hypothetical protein